jgi:PadR family transcriptional regulator, regulatory protein AphA
MTAFSRVDISTRYVSTRYVKKRNLRNQKTRFAVLGMLTLQPMSGYDIRKAVDESIAHFWNESYGQIYPILKELAKDGLITAHTSRSRFRNRQEYAITAAGRAALEAWLGTAPRNDVVRNELLLKLFFARNAPLRQSLSHLEEYRRSQAAELRHFRSMERDLMREHSTHRDLPYWLITLRFGISHCEATIRWAENALRELQQSTHNKRKGGRK